MNIVSRYDADKVLVIVPGDTFQGADLRGADLQGAYLQGAVVGPDVTVSDKPRPYFTIRPIGSRSDTLMVFATSADIYVITGCFQGTRDAFATAVEATHGATRHADDYRAALIMIDQYFKVES